MLRVCLLVAAFCLNLRPATAQITVTSSTPNNAQQGTTTLNVTVAGSGFEQGGIATWYVTGTTSTGGVTVNSTTFVNSSQLVANISIAANATVSGYDVTVKNSNGRTGVGSDLFTVNPEAVTSALYSTDESGSNVTIRGDGLVTDPSGASTYENNPSNCSTLDPQGSCIIMSLLPNDWYLRLSSTSGRALHLTFLKLGNSPDESGLDGDYLAQVATRCFNSSNNWVSIPLTIPLGTSNNHCSFRVNFVANGVSYFFIMSPTYAGTGWSTVACISGSPTASCNTWSITPTPGNLLPKSSLANVANLYSVAKSGKLTLLGKYSMTFNVTLTQE
jgi:hypothetical protein